MFFSVSLNRYVRFVIATSLSGALISPAIFAGAFQLWEQDSGGVGNYHSGAAAEANTAANVFYNPAGASRLKHQQISFGAALIPLQMKYTGTVSTTTTTYITLFNVPQPPTTSTAVDQVSNAAGDTANIVPNFSYALPLSKDWVFALSATTPFGLETDYPNISPVNSLATKTQLRTINLNPSIAYQVNRYLSLGVGFDELYGQAIYDSNALEPLRTDLDGWNCGYNAGLLWQFTKATRVGISYRSAITVNAKGPSHSQTIPSLNDTASVPVNTTASADFSLPATTIFSVYHDVNSRLTLMTSAFYTQWSVFNQLIMRNLATPTGAGTIALNENYRDTWNLSLGGKYRITHAIWLNAGVGHDETPTRINYRDIRLPDNDRYAVSLGVDIKPSPGFLWSMGWTHFFIPTTAINNTLSNDTSKTNIPAYTFVNIPDVTSVALRQQPSVGVGSVAGDVNVLGIQLTCDID